jgi:hypothetical protein
MQKTCRIYVFYACSEKGLPPSFVFAAKLRDLQFG